MITNEPNRVSRRKIATVWPPRSCELARLCERRFKKACIAQALGASMLNQLVIMDRTREAFLDPCNLSHSESARNVLR